MLRNYANATEIFYRNQPTSITIPVHPTSTFVNATGTYLAWSNGGITLFPQITLQQYISVSFVPLILAVIYSIPWRVLDSTIREMEPFYQLHRHGGALGRDSLCLDYGSSFLVTVIFKALSRGHFIPLCSSLISLIILALSPLASEAFFVSLGTGCYTNTKETCNAFWGVYPILARVIQAILSFVAVLLVLLIIFDFGRSSGVYSEPLSIAGSGVLLCQSPLVNWLLGVESTISNKELRKNLALKRFALSWSTGEDEIRSYGIVPLEDGSEEGFTIFGKKHRYNHVPTNEIDMNKNRPQRRSYRRENLSRTFVFWQVIKEKTVFIMAFLIFGGLLAMISYYHWTGQNSAGQSTAFETFMDSRGFGVRFMMSALGVVVKLLWSRIDTGTYHSNYKQIYSTDDCRCQKKCTLCPSPSRFFCASRFNSPSCMAISPVGCHSIYPQAPLSHCYCEHHRLAYRVPAFVPRKYTV